MPSPKLTASMPRDSRRAIDDLTNESRQLPMKVLCLGLSRTATMSMQLALNKLGYSTYHFNQVPQSHLPNESHISCWSEAFVAKMYNNGKKYGKEEFDRLLRNYDAVTDAPCCCFADELIEAYPDAKVILTNRDPQKWLASMETVYYMLLTSPRYKWYRAVGALDMEFIGPVLELLRLVLRYWTSDDWENREKLLQTFDTHYKHVREITPKNNLLEWTTDDGWQPLCEFLSKPIPQEPFPWINKGMAAAELHIPIGWGRATVLLFDAIKWPVAILAGILSGFLLLRLVS